MADSADKRSVSTDALETLGMVHFREEKRDAIHLAVMPVEAGETLRPGTHIGVSKNGKAYAVAREHCIGIVDPFLTEPVSYRDRFWLVIYPRKIQSLRHVWSHPALPDEAPAVASAEPAGDFASAKARIRDMAADLDCSVERLMDGAASFLEHGECLHFGHDLDYDWPAEDFWRCYEIVTGKPVASKEFFFRCSC